MPREVDYERTGRLLMSKRKYRQKTVKELSEETMISRNALYTYERGEGIPATYQLVVLADYYGCMLDDLLVYKQGGTNEPDIFDRTDHKRS